MKAGKFASRVGAGAPIYLAAALEHLTRDTAKDLKVQTLASPTDRATMVAVKHRIDDRKENEATDDVYAHVKEVCSDHTAKTK